MNEAIATLLISLMCQSVPRYYFDRIILHLLLIASFSLYMSVDQFKFILIGKPRYLKVLFGG